MPTNAHERAKTLDGGIEQSVEGLALRSLRDSVAQIRTYLQWQDADLGHRNNVARILRMVGNHGLTFISVGPSFDHGPTESHFKLESGARLSFGITLREANGRCSLVAYRFHLSLPEGQSPSFYRFDLNEKAHETPLTEPRCHYHPGVDKVRLPCPVLTPLEVFDRIFLVIEPQLLAAIEPP
ncbi:MAG: hypothetical protein NTW28_27395 [Candidatus Solibacter sp.]|nr:hypothetical protein [Candidatus Solibacter sp.]